MKMVFKVLAFSAMLGGPLAAQTHTVDTGTPNGSAVGAFAFDANDWYAGQVVFGSSVHIIDVFAHVLGGAQGETFTISLYDDSATHVPGNALHTTTAVYTADGWNGVGALSGWNVAAGLYWIGLEIGFGDTLGSTSDTGALLDAGVPNPLTRTAFDAGSGYVATASPLRLGLQLDAVAATVPEPGSIALLFSGAGALLAVAQRRRR